MGSYSMTSPVNYEQVRRVLPMGFSARSMGAQVVITSDLHTDAQLATLLRPIVYDPSIKSIPQVVLDRIHQAQLDNAVYLANAVSSVPRNTEQIKALTRQIDDLTNLVLGIVG